MNKLINTLTIILTTTILNATTIKCNNATPGEYMNIDGYDYYVVKDKQELIKKINNKERLEFLCTSYIKDMSEIFLNKREIYDITEWDVSNVENMTMMFQGSVFNQNISSWDISKVKYMDYMFYNSKFEKDISNWNLENKSKINYIDCTKLSQSCNKDEKIQETKPFKKLFKKINN